MTDTPQPSRARVQPAGVAGLSRAEAAAYLRIAPRTFDRYVMDGRITKHRLVPRGRPYFLVAELDAFVRADGAA